MTWRASLLPASFRGAHFKVESAESELGRRAVRHDFPQRDLPYYEDMGRKARAFTLTAFVVGEFYKIQLDQLLRACEAEGPGELIHPYRGTVRVQCLGVTLSESTSDGRMARLSLTFGEAGELRFPSVERDPVTSVTVAAAALQQLAQSEFEEDLLVTGKPEYVRAAASDEVQAFAEEVEKLDVFGGAVDQVADLRRRISDLIRDAVELVTKPFELAREVDQTVQGIVSASASDTIALLALRRVIDRLSFLHDDADAAHNARTVTSLVRRSAILAAGRTASGAAYETRSDALVMRDALTDAIDAEAEAGSDEAFQALMDLRTAVCGAVPPPDQDLPELGTVTLAAATPALVVAYELYGDPERDVEILRRNKVRHPGFVPASTPLEVLVDA